VSRFFPPPRFALSGNRRLIVVESASRAEFALGAIAVIAAIAEEFQRQSTSPFSPHDQP
jgi:hypothetical protein